MILMGLIPGVQREIKVGESFKDGAGRSYDRLALHTRKKQEWVKKPTALTGGYWRK